jgi:pSer/pThr/pTyr-binding forkhead associated (FHA) protein
MALYDIRVSSSEQSAFQIESPGTQGYIIGRSDESSEYKPDIDLAGYNARDKGVSRRHVALIRYQGVTHVLDLHSVNGTYINGKKLPSDVPHPLHSGDEVRLGNLELTFIQVG